MKGLLKEPLLHFLIAGGLLFAAYAWLNQDVIDEPRTIQITTAEVNWLKETWSRRWSRQPDEQELRGLVANHLKEKLLAREARELDLELDDTVVRRRLAQKMEFLVQDTASIMQPGEAELQKFYDQNTADYLSPAQVSFEQIFFKQETSAHQGLEQLATQAKDQLGDSSLLARELTLKDDQVVTNIFGPEFSKTIFTLKPGDWQGPIVSSYGFHLVKISELRQAKQQPFAEVRDQVLANWQRIQREQLEQQYYEELLSKYDVVLDEEVASLVGSLTETVQ